MLAPIEELTSVSTDPGREDLIDAVLRNSHPSEAGRIASDVLVLLKQRAEAIRTVAELAPLVEELLSLICLHPQDERLQRLVAVAFGRVQDSRAESVWRGIDRRFPNSDLASIRVARAVYRSKGTEAAKDYIEQRLAGRGNAPEDLFLLARAYFEIREPDLAEDPIRAVVEHPETGKPLLIKAANLLLKHGWLADADDAAQLLRAKFGDSHEANLLVSEVGHLRGLGGAGDKKVSAVLVGVIDRIIETAQDVRRLRDTSRSPRSLGSVVMIGGSLAAGGAERQFVQTALGLNQAAQTGAPIADVNIQGPVIPLLRSLHSRAGDDFYLAQLRDANLKIYEYSSFELFGGRARNSLVQPVASLIPHLPGRAQEGILRLADALRYLAPEVVHIWQDGSILATGLAAVLAGVPRIILGGRNMPPTERHDREKPEYFPIFQSLIAQPGVTLLSNSRLVAMRYAEWLGRDYRDVRVVPNGVAIPEMTPTARSLELAESLPKGADRFIVGCVARFAEAKRPLLWIDCAAAILKKCPEAYFVMVGRGPLLEAAASHAESLGIRDHILLCGATPDVGFWFSQMNVHLLLSRYEGLPNVLIEAQMCGVPVVTTPAGGSAEAVDPGVTGTVLETAEIVDVQQVADTVLSWRRDAAGRAALSDKTRAWATNRFSIERMLELTVQIYMESGAASPARTLAE